MNPAYAANVQLVLALLSSFAFVLMGTPVLIRLAFMRKLFDTPDGSRKIHRRLVPSLGGVMLFIAIIMGYSFSGQAEQLAWYPYLFGGLVALFFVGLKDDLIGLSPGAKLIFEILLCSVFIFASSGVILDFGGVLGIGTVPIWIGFPVTLFTMIVVMNAYNLIDGLDGLAGGIGAMASFWLGVGYLVADMVPIAVLAMAVCIVLVGYLYHNFHPASIFMGDSGSLTIGFLLAVLSIHFVPLSGHASFAEVMGAASPVLPVAFLSYPLYDTIRSFLRRALSGRSPFEPDRSHIHHVLMDTGFGQRRTVLYLCAATMVPILVVLAGREMSPTVMLALALGAMLLVYPTNGFKRRLLRRVGVDVEGWIRPAVDLTPRSTREATRLRFTPLAAHARKEADQLGGDSAAGGHEPGPDASSAPSRSEEGANGADLGAHQQQGVSNGDAASGGNGQSGERKNGRWFESHLNPN